MSDWDTVPITLRKRAPKGSAMKSEQVRKFRKVTRCHRSHAPDHHRKISIYFYFQAVNAARRQGVAVDTQTKCK